MIDHPDMDLEEDVGHLAPFAREQYVQGANTGKKRKADFLGTWDAWNMIRSVCKYHSRLFVGEIDHHSFLLSDLCTLHPWISLTCWVLLLNYSCGGTHSSA